MQYIIIRRLAQKRTTQTQRRRWTSKNPLKSLAARVDIKNEYIELNSGVSERMTHKILNADTGIGIL